MTDITKCANKTCPLKEKCHRFTSTACSFRQSYCNFSYDTIEGHTTCDYFWDNEGREKLKVKKRSREFQVNDTVKPIKSRTDVKVFGQIDKIAKVQSVNNESITIRFMTITDHDTICTYNVDEVELVNLK